MLYRDCQRLVNLDRNVFAACMVACGDADAMVTGVTRNSFDVLDEVTAGDRGQARARVMFGLTILLARERPLCSPTRWCTRRRAAAQLAEIADAGGGEGA